MIFVLFPALMVACPGKEESETSQSAATASPTACQVSTGEFAKISLFDKGSSKLLSSWVVIENKLANSKEKLSSQQTHKVFLIPGVYKVFAGAEGFKEVESEDLIVQKKDCGSEDDAIVVELKTEPVTNTSNSTNTNTCASENGTLKVRVFDKVSNKALKASLALVRDEPLFSVRKDNTSNFKFTLEKGAYRLTVDAPGYITFRSAPIALTSPCESESKSAVTFDVALDPLERGRVITENTKQVTIRKGEFVTLKLPSPPVPFLWKVKDSSKDEIRVQEFLEIVDEAQGKTKIKKRYAFYRILGKKAGKAKLSLVFAEVENPQKIQKRYNLRIEVLPH